MKDDCFHPPSPWCQWCTCRTQMRYMDGTRMWHCCRVPFVDAVVLAADGDATLATNGHEPNFFQVVDSHACTPGRCSFCLSGRRYHVLQ